MNKKKQKEYLLGIDVGTHGSKGAITNKSGEVMASASCTHETIIPKPGYAEHDALTWWNDFVFLTKELINKSEIKGEDISAVGCSAIAPTMLPLDKNGVPLRNAILYGIDTRSKNEVREMTDKIGEKKLIEKNGAILSTQSVGPKILWYMKNEPELFKRTRKIVTLNVEEGPSYGAALIASVGVGMYSSIEDAVGKIIREVNEINSIEKNVKKYRKLYNIYKSLYNDLKVHFKELAEI